MSTCRHLSSDDANGSDHKNVCECYARQGPAQCALQSAYVMMDGHLLLLLIL
jgi:hypothetical protein